MSEFKPITTQEEFDNAIKARIERERHTQAEKYADYDELKNKIAGFETQIGDLNAALDGANEKIANHTKEIEERDQRIGAYETASVKTRIAHELGLSYDAISFLQGSDEDSIRKSAETLKGLVGSGAPQPMFNPEPVQTESNKTEAALKELSNKLKGE